ncbi:MAG TPA: major capsid protein [Candidatus Omnitrophota bacterium]|nr:major capsid protein [Candidatus Omnitrophota bacterium]
MPPLPPAAGPHTVRMVDPVLTTVAQGYRNAKSVGNALFPSVPVFARAGIILKFGDESFRLYNLRRAPGGPVLEVQFGYDGGQYSIKQNALSAKIPVEIQAEAQNVHNVDLGAGAMAMTMQIQDLAMEYEQAGLARNAANYDADHKIALGAGTEWSDPDSNPLTQISTGKEAISDTTGEDANTFVLSPKAWKGVRENPHVVERFKYTTSGPVTLQQFAALIEVDNVAIGRKRYVDDDGAFQPVWGNDAILAWVAPGARSTEAAPNPLQRAMPSYGYTYTLQGSPVAEQPYYDNDTRSWKYPTIHEAQPQLTGMLAGYLFQGAGG